MTRAVVADADAWRTEWPRRTKRASRRYGERSGANGITANPRALPLEALVLEELGGRRGCGGNGKLVAALVELGARVPADP